MREPRPAETAILVATERLLARRPFSELAVNDIIVAAGVSRTTFYAHFTSRTAVLVACLHNVAGEVRRAVDPLSAAVCQDDPATAIHASLERWVTLADDHGALLRTVSEEWPHDGQLRDLWFEVMGAVSVAVAAMIEGARACGAAPPGADPDALAACLTWGYERVLHVAIVGDAPGLDDPSGIVEPLSQMMLAGVFGRPGAT